jgi:hypothetical protein
VRLLRTTPLVALLAGCGAGTHTAATRLPDRAGPVRATYVVSAPVLEMRGTQRACDAILSSAPPTGCSGVTVTGWDFAHLAGVVRYGSVGWQTPVLRLTGRWNGHALVVSRVTETKVAPPAPGAPGRCLVRPRPRGEALARRMAHDNAAGIQLMAFGPCGRRAWALVPVANRSSVRTIRQRYGDVIVSGWLRRARRRVS